MRDVRNCKRCGKIFIYVGSPICLQCLDKQEKQFHIVKDYLTEHPKASVSEVSDGTEVPVEIVVEFLKQGMLLAHSGPEGQLTCAICKKPIIRGSICPKCEAAMLGASGAGSGKDSLTRGEGVKVRDRMYSMDIIGRRRR